jgi:hypothetical protein
VREPSARGIWQWRWALLIYWGGAAVLAIWIIILLVEQPARGYTDHPAVVGGGIVLFFAAGAVSTGVLYQRRSALALIAATVTTTVTFITAWFNLTVFIHHLAHQFIYSLIYVPEMLFLAWVAVRVLRAATAGGSLPRWVPWICFAVPVLILPWSFAVLISLPAILEVHRLRVAWTGLDLFELTAMIAIGVFIRHDSPKLAVGAAALGALLCCDAWFDVLTSTGIDQLLGLALAAVELPLAMYSLVLATQVVRSWGSRMRPSDTRDRL